MRKLLLTAAASTVALASPAHARDGQGYVGIEGGILFGAKSHFNLDVYNEPFIGEVETGNGDLHVDYKTGFDGDLVGGYDFGIVRGELELGYKTAGIDSFDLSTDIADPILPDGTYNDINGKMKIWSLMANLLFDFGNQDGLSFYVGPGFGRAWTRMRADDPDGLSYARKDNAWAWQLIAGVRYAVTPNIDLGLKYRYFRTGKLHYDDIFNTEGVTYTDITCQSVGIAAEAVPAQTACSYWADGTGHFRSHSVLASLIYNFGEPAAPPPPPPPPPPPEPAPATQTCYDGSVILATDVCPSPPPPPPPPPAPERG